MNLLLELFIAEESAQYPEPADLGKHDGMSPRVVERWLIALADRRLVERNDRAVALTEHGYDTVVRVLEAMFKAQRMLD
jgi:CTP-dependent riboflavin kinase